MNNITMDLQARKIAFVTEFFRLQNENVISSFENLLRKRRYEIYKNNLEQMSIEKLCDDIDQSLIDSDNDRVIKASDLKSKYA